VARPARRRPVRIPLGLGAAHARPRPGPRRRTWYLLVEMRSGELRVLQRFGDVASGSAAQALLAGEGIEAYLSPSDPIAGPIASGVAGFALLVDATEEYRARLALEEFGGAAGSAARTSDRTSDGRSDRTSDRRSDRTSGGGERSEPTGPADDAE